MQKRSNSSTNFYLGTRWRWVVSFTLRPLQSRWSNRRYPLGGPRTGLETVKKIKISCHCRESNLGHKRLVYRYTDWANPARVITSNIDVMCFQSTCISICCSCFKQESLRKTINATSVISRSPGLGFKFRSSRIQTTSVNKYTFAFGSAV
jgi:hypothetical protein